MPTFNDARIRDANGITQPARGEYVLYWMQAYRRLTHNHALDHALQTARQLKKPLVVYEGLRLDYPWACARHHRFMMDGMLANLKRAKKLGVNYWPYLETPDQPARGLLKKLAASACLLVTDDYPAFVVPAQTAALAGKITAPLHAVDGNSLVPLSMLGAAVSAAAHLRPRIHKLIAEAWQHRAGAEPVFTVEVRKQVDPPFEPADEKRLARVDDLPINQFVPPVAGVTGGTVSGRERLQHFVKHKLPRYADGRNQPDDPAENAASGLSPWLRHGHLSIQEVAEAALGDGWTPARLNPSARGKREGYYHEDPNVNSFLDEAITWRDVGQQWHFRRNAECGMRSADWKTKRAGREAMFLDLSSALPGWAKATLDKHAADEREHVYSLEAFEAADTHDPLWNAAQTELVKTGRIHNYLRMLWGKKVLEWSASPDEAYRVLEHLNNKYAIDGRDPNSYTGILWCFGLFDRPWAPERKVYGVLRYMSSDNTARKYKLADYFEYIRRLGPLSTP